MQILYCRMLAVTSIVALMGFQRPCTSRVAATQGSANKTIAIRKGVLTLVLHMAFDHGTYSEAHSDRSWGLFTENNYRCASMDVTVAHQRLRFSDELFRPLSNIVRASLSQSNKTRQFAVHIGGGDAGAAYWATITFKYIKSRNRYEPVSRVIRSAEFPNQYYEKCVYHMWW